ncbi:hypothetical protein Tco_0013105 [Tanacetum coccineum]
MVLNKETMRIEESLNVTFYESLSEPKESPSVEDDRINELIVQDLNRSPSLQVNVSDEGYPKSVKEARGHPIEQVISELNEMTLRTVHTVSGDGVANPKQRRQDFQDDDVRDLTMASEQNIDQFLYGFTQPRNEIDMDDLEPDDESVDTPLVSHFLESDDDFDDGEVINELEEYGNAGHLSRQREINSFDGDDLAFQLVDGLESTRKNLVAIVRDVYVFVGSFTYITDFVILEDIGEFILRDVTPPKSGSSGMVTMGCYVKVQQSRSRKRP